MGFSDLRAMVICAESIEYIFYSYLYKKQVYFISLFARLIGETILKISCLPGTTLVFCGITVFWHCPEKNRKSFSKNRQLPIHISSKWQISISTIVPIFEVLFLYLDGSQLRHFRSRFFHVSMGRIGTIFIIPSGNLTQLLKISHLQLIYLLKAVIFHSCVSLPEGICCD